MEVIQAKKLTIEFDNGSLVKDKKKWTIKYLGLRITVPIGRSLLSIEKVQCSISDLQNTKVLNRLTQEAFLYLFPVEGERKNSEVKRVIQSGENSLCRTPDIHTGVWQDGKYELLLEIKCTAGQKGIEASLSRKFIVESKSARWNA